MKKLQILRVQKNLSIPWFEQIEKTFYSIRPPDYVTALAQTKESKFIILKQYRPAIEDYTYELPSGHVENGENPKDARTSESCT